MTPSVTTSVSVHDRHPPRSLIDSLSSCSDDDSGREIRAALDAEPDLVHFLSFCRVFPTEVFSPLHHVVKQGNLRAVHILLQEYQVHVDSVKNSRRQGTTTTTYIIEPEQTRVLFFPFLFFFLFFFFRFLWHRPSRGSAQKR